MLKSEDINKNGEGVVTIMGKQMKCIIIGFIVILLSTPLGYKSTNILNQIKGNLSGEYIILLNGFIHSFMLVGLLIFSIGLLDILFNKNIKNCLSVIKLIFINCK